MSKTKFLSVAAFLAAGSFGLATVPALAQSAAPATPQAGAQAQSFSNKQIQQFANAEKKVGSIRQKWISKMQGVKDKKKMTEYRKKANEEMVAAAKNSGLSVEQFNAIARAAQSNPELAKKIKAAE